MSNDILQRAYVAYEQGDYENARTLVNQVLAQDPTHSQALILKLSLDQHTTPSPPPQSPPPPANEIAPLESRMMGSTPDTGTTELPTLGEALPTTEKPKKPMVGAPVPPLSSQMGGGQRVETVGTYQMLWDCDFCGAEKLLGLDHRFCPNCGAQQRAEWRYFPDQSEAVEVVDHVYHGADVVCPSCQTLSSAAAEFCGNCGTPLTDAAQARLREMQQQDPDGLYRESDKIDEVKEKHAADQARMAAAAQQQHGIMGRFQQFTRRQIIAGGSILTTVLMTCIGIIAAFFWTETSTVMVTGHSWEREIQIEEYQSVSEGNWCDSMPSGAYSVSRSERQRGSRQVADGETCSNRRVDNGDGTFRTERVCQTRYRSEPVYDQYCNYTIDKWDYERSEFTRGNNLSDNPAWPSVSLNDRSGTNLGDERESNRIETYNVSLRSNEGETYTCTFNSVNEWRRYPANTEWTIQIAVVGNRPQCGSLAPAG